MLSFLLRADVVALVGGLVHSMVPGEAPRVATVLVRDGRIAAVAPELELPAGCERHDVSGLHLVPGLVDAMTHFDPAHDALYLSSGVTVVRDVGGNRVRALIERDASARERTPGPTLYTCGAVLDGDPPSSPDAAILRDASAAEDLLPILFEDPVDFLVTHLGLPPAAWKRSIELAHEQGLQLWGPVPRDVAFADALAAPQDGIFYLDRLVPESSSWSEVRMEDLEPRIEALAAAGIPIVPLLQATAVRLGDQRGQTSALTLLAPEYESWWQAELRDRLASLDELTLDAGKAVLEKQCAVVRRLHEAGVPLVPGSGTPHPWLFPGRSLHQELALWVEAGVPAADVLRLVTSGAADALGLAARHGTLAPGKVADVLCVPRDPREDVGALAEPALIVQRGRVFTAADVEDLLERLATQQLAARDRVEVPLEFVDPPRPEGAVVLTGVVESRSLDQRIAVESFAVVQEPGGTVAYTGRIRYATGEEMTIEQRTRDDLLEDFRIIAKVNGSEILCEGVWVAGSLRLRRTVAETVLDTKSMPVRPVCADVASVTSLMILGQRSLEHPFPVVTFHEMFEPEQVQWSLSLTEKGDHRVRMHSGWMAFRFDEHGAPLIHRTKIGEAVVETRLVGARTFGGPGHPLPRSKEEAAAPVEAGAGDGGGR